MQLRVELINALPGIIREIVKPMEPIDGIKISQVEGLSSHSSHSGQGEGGNNGGGSLSDQLVNSALRYRGQAPLVDSLLADIGLKGGDINGLTEMLKVSGPDNS